MSKFRITKKFALDFLADEWKDCFIVFSVLTVADIKTKFPAISELSEVDKKDVTKGLEAILDILKEKFVSGTGLNDKGELVELVASDLEELPVEILSKALSFLSQGGKEPSIVP